jgi:hypothetical protein
MVNNGQQLYYDLTTHIIYIDIVYIYNIYIDIILYIDIIYVQT